MKNNQLKRTFMITSTTLGVMLLMTGCVTSRYQDISKSATSGTDLAKKTYKQVAAPLPLAPTSSEMDAFYVDKVAMQLKDDGLPEIFNKNLQMMLLPRATLREATTNLARQTKMRFSFSPDVQPDSDKPLFLAGFTSETTLKGFLDQVTAMPNPALSWQFKDGQIELFRYQTRVFALNMPSADKDFVADASNKNSGGASGGGASTSSGHAVTETSKPRFWLSVDKEIQQMLTPGVGKLVVSQSTRSATVTDTPQALNAVSAYVKNLNATALRRVYLSVEIVTVSESSTDNAGINWNLIYSTMANKYGVTLSSPAVPSTISAGAGAISGILNAGSGNFKTSTALLSILSSLGKTANVATYPQWTMSDVPTHTLVNHSQGYAASVVTAQPTVVGGSVTQTITPGTVNYGTSLHSNPHVMGEDEIELEESIQISTLDGITLFGSSSSGEVQLPQQTATSFFPVVTMKSGQTLVLAGLQELNSVVNQEGMGSADNDLVVGATGNRAGTSTKNTVVVLITPYLM